MAEQKITVVQCVNGHHFNADKFNACPICGAAMKPMAIVEPEDDKRKEHFFNPGGKKDRKDKDKKTEKKPDDRTQGKAENLTPPSRLVDDDVTKGLLVYEQPPETDDRVQNQDRSTEYVPETPPETPQGSGTEPTSDPKPDDRVQNQDRSTEYVPETPPEIKPDPASGSGTEPTQETPQSSGTEPFVAEVKNAKSGQTIGFFARPGKKETNNNPENTSNNANNDSTSNSGAGNSSTRSTEAIEPPVGWLVCVKGMEFGKAFPIKNGQNTIGRAPSCAIPLLGDGYVSRGVHAKIKYEPIKRKFTLIAGDTSGLTYLNGEDIDVPCELKAYDKISLSAGVADANSYMFVPLCGENFTWEDYI